MGLTIKGMRPGVLFRAACRPTGIVMGLVGLACIFAIMLLVPWSQYALAGILGPGIGCAFCASHAAYFGAVSLGSDILSKVSVRKRGNGAR